MRRPVIAAPAHWQQLGSGSSASAADACSSSSSSSGTRGSVAAAAAGKGFGAPKAAAAGSKTPSKCPCGSGKTYQACCGRHHEGLEPAPTPEALLRSRFTAYRLALTDYLVATTHPANPERRGLDDRAYGKALGKTARNNQFISLKVDGEEPGPTEDEAYVMFTVQTRPNSATAQGKPPETVKERSHFKREDGRWLYLDFK